ncbi:MAG: NADH-quinone oxidoreductase subunit NuoH [Deltaproteobacteria bacterium]|nr:NADH-quinone oxidoreductase subunit NuoH [Deltaproteobacteria bacterium]
MSAALHPASAPALAQALSTPHSLPHTAADLVAQPWLASLLGVGAIMAFLTLNVLFLIWAERKVSAWIQRRMGPTEVGPYGLFQTLADMLKLISKQLITPSHVDRPLYLLAPLVVFAPVVVAVSLFPFAPGLAVTDVDLGLLLVFAFAGLGIIGIFMAGWGSNNKYALLGAMRSVAQNVSYEIPLILSALAVVLLASHPEGVTLEAGTPSAHTVPLLGTSLAHITLAQEAQGYWFVLVQPVAFVIYFVAALAETNRAPFDIPEAESELVAGFHTEYSGMRFAMFFFAEYTNMLVVSMVATVLFLGGWDGPLLPGPVWFFLKTYTLLFGMIWVRWTWPRLRFDQLMRLCWGLLVPVAILNLLGAAVLAEVL